MPLCPKCLLWKTIQHLDEHPHIMIRQSNIQLLLNLDLEHNEYNFVEGRSLIWKFLYLSLLKQPSIFMQPPSICATKILLQYQPHNITRSVYCCGTPGSFPASLSCFLTLTSLWWSAPRAGNVHMLEDLQQQNMSLIQAFWYYSAPVYNIHLLQTFVLVRYVTNTFVVQDLRFHCIIQKKHTHIIPQCHKTMKYS